MRFQGLGPFVVSTDRSEIVVKPCRRSQLLIVLLANANKVVSTTQVVREIWDDNPPGNTMNSLHAIVTRLRRDVTAWSVGRVQVVHRHPGYVLVMDESCLDITEFTRLADATRRAWATDPQECVKLARRALALWQGIPFSGHPLGRLGTMARVRLEEAHLATLEFLMDAGLELGLHRQLVGELRELAVAHPFREQFYGQLILALYRCGRQREALEAFQLARRILNDELGVAPSPPLCDTFVRVLRQDPDLWHGAAGRRGAMGRLSDDVELARAG